LEGSSSSRISSYSRRRQKNRKLSKGHKFKEFRKAKPPSFDDEIKKGEEEKAWLLGLKKYFRVQDLSWEQFEKHFWKKYLSKKYFDEKTKEFYELKLGQLTIEKYVNKFLYLLRYVPYLKVEKAKVQCFISGLPKDYRDRIEFDEPKTLEGTI
jgi:hypothetical protein